MWALVAQKPFPYVSSGDFSVFIQASVCWNSNFDLVTRAYLPGPSAPSACENMHQWITDVNLQAVFTMIRQFNGMFISDLKAPQGEPHWSTK